MNNEPGMPMARSHDSKTQEPMSGERAGGNAHGEDARVEIALIALEDGSIVLPRAVIAETTTVLSYRREASTEIEGTRELQKWRAPDLTWQGQTIPVIDPMVLVDPARDAVNRSREGSRFVIVLGTLDPKRLPFYALIVRGTPHAVVLTRSRIEALDDYDATPWLWKVRAAGVVAHLLRLDTCEQRLLASM
ncbi:MAG: chemotaxis protein CheW [Thioalkalivibrionaceae bacterium]